ncbi:MAG: hypothetical protein HQM06_05020 [Magnetococcales bacterium]|nr:hypothetical protein [Magnetococcales bacterium]
MENILIILLVALLVVGVLLWQRRKRLLAAEQMAARLAETSGSRRRAAQLLEETDPVEPAAPMSEESAAPAAVTPAQPIQITADYSRLPPQLPWVGRQKIFAQLDQWLADPQIALVHLTAPPGGGKSRLLQVWSEKAAAERSLPIRHAHNQENSAALLQTLAQQPQIIVLDEPLESSLTTLTAGVWNDRLLVVATEAKSELPGEIPTLALDPLKENEAMQLLHELGVRGKFADFRPLLKGLAGHPLLLTLFGRLISVYYQGNIANFKGQMPALQPLAAGQQLQHLLKHYAESIRPAPFPHYPLLRELATGHYDGQENALRRHCVQIALLSVAQAADADYWSELMEELRQTGWLMQDDRRLHPLLKAQFQR